MFSIHRLFSSVSFIRLLSSSSIPFWSDNMLCTISLDFILLSFVFGSRTWCILSVPCALEKSVYFTIVGWSVLKISVRSCWMIVLFRSSTSVLASSSSCNKIPWARWLKQQRLISHSSGGWEVEDQGAGQFGPWWGKALFLACRWFPSHCVFTWPFLGAQRDLSLPFLIRPPIWSDLDPILMNSFNLNYLLKSLSPNIVTMEVRASTYGFGEYTIQSIAISLLIF